jgi:hypothetical protein
VRDLYYIACFYYAACFYYIGCFDSFEGSHRRIFVSERHARREFQSTEDICRYAWTHREVLDWIHSHGPGGGLRDVRRAHPRLRRSALSRRRPRRGGHPRTVADPTMVRSPSAAGAG